MKKITYLLVGVAFASILFVNCSKDSTDANDASTATEQFTLGKDVNRTFNGVVVDENDQPLAGVAIEMGGVTTTTNADGEYILSNVTVKERFAYVKATKSGYINGSRVIATHEGLNGVKKIMMLTKNVVAIIPSGQPSLVTMPNNTVNVSFDGAFVKADGSNYNGNVKVYMNYLNPTEETVIDKMPGSLFGLRTDGTYSGMKTYGMVAVELYSTNNEKLQLAPNHKSTISMKIPSEMSSTADSTIPLWYFDEAKGVWIEEGHSTKVGDRYVGSVSHFTYWNNDYAYPVANLTVTARSFDNSLVKGAKVYITSTAIIESHSRQPLNIFFGETNSNGTLSDGIPTNVELTAKIYTANNVLIRTVVLPASGDMYRYINLSVPAPNKN